MTHAIVTGARTRRDDGLIRHAADLDDAMTHAFLERRERDVRKAGHVALVGRRADDDVAVGVEQRGDARVDTVRVIAQHGANRRVVAAARNGCA